MPFLPLDLLRAGALELGIDLSERQLEQCDEFAVMVVEANRQFNLTRIIEPEEMVIHHYLDSLLCLSAVDITRGAKVIDIGTGAGFPGVPVKIARPDLAVTLLDATFKKIRFLSEAIEKLGMQGVEMVHARAEELAHEKSHPRGARYREQFDLACVRALSEMKVAAELCVPLVKVGGRMLAAKSAGIDEELRAARPIIGELGGTIEKIVRTHIPTTDIVRQFVVVVKSKPTPERFPRPYGMITRKKHEKAASSE